MYFSRFGLKALLLLSVIVFSTLSSEAQIECAHFRKACFSDQLKTADASDGSREDIHQLNAFWQIDPAIRFITGGISYRFVVLSAQYDSLRLELSPSLIIDSVLLDGNQVEWERSSRRLSIPVDGALPATQHAVSVFYHGEPGNSGFGSFVQSSTPEGFPIIWTLSQPDGAADWWPIKAGLSDKIDSSDFVIRIPPGNKAACNGKLIMVDTLQDALQFHWQHRYPVAPYLVAVAVTAYDEIRSMVPLSVGEVELLNYCFPSKRGEWEWQQAEVKAMFLYFDSLFVPYPFMREKYGHAQFGWGGGMEHQTMSFMADLGPWLTSHELAHQWFGNLVTCSSWKDIWLNEGFATWMTGLFFERFNPPAFYYWKRNNILEIVSQPDGSVMVDDTTLVSRIFNGRLSYYKGAMVLHMLRMQLGDAAFWQACRNYLNDPDLQFGFATTDDFRQHAESVSGISLEDFFDAWIRSEGHPRVSLLWRNEVGGVRLRLRQRASTGESTIFPMHLPIRMKSGLQLKDTTVVFDVSALTLTIPSGFVVDSIIPDGDADVIAEFEIGRLSMEESSGGLYPNPSQSGILWYDIEVLPQPIKAELWDYTGRLIQSAIPVYPELGRLGFDTGGLANGLYIIRLQLSDKVLMLPFVRVKK